MARSIITGIDIGTHHIKVVISDARETVPGKKEPKIIGVGTAESHGLRHGYIVNMEDAVASIKSAVVDAEKRAGVKVKKAFLGIGGIGLSGVTNTTSIIISRADLEITHLDMKRVQEQCEKDIPVNALLNRKILHSIPIHYKIDGKVILGKPEGMKGSKFEIKTLYVTCLEQHLNDFIQAVEDAGVGVEDVMASPIASSLVTLTKSQKVAGCVLTNIGAETVSISVFENNVPVSIEVFPIGSTDITNDIALGLKVPLEEAEQIKIGAITGSSFPRKKLDEIVFARLSDIFELIEAHLKKIGRNGLLPAGIVITGGGSGLNQIEDMAKGALRLPSRLGYVVMNDDGLKSSRDAKIIVAYGLCILGVHTDEDLPIDTSSRIFQNSKRTIIAWLKQFLP